MEIVQANTKAMLIIESNTEASSYIRLPSIYQEVAYISRNGNNYIDTEWIPKQTVPFEVQIWYKISTSWVRYWVLSNYQNIWDWELSFEINAWWVTNNRVRYYVQTSNPLPSTQEFSSNSLTLNAFNDIKITNNASNWQSITLNWTFTNISQRYTWTYQNYSAYLFIDRSLRRSTFSYNSMCSYLKIYENGTLIKDFIPCYRKSDNVIWFRESKGRKFYTNKWSWTFAKWPDV